MPTFLAEGPMIASFFDASNVSADTDSETGGEAAPLVGHPQSVMDSSPGTCCFQVLTVEEVPIVSNWLLGAY